MDPRLAARRQKVLEDRARGGARRAIWLMVVVVLAGAMAWVLQSPLLSVASIDVSGATRADVAGALEESGVVVGRALLATPVADAEAALLDDPWVADAAVDRVFPDRIEVRVIEHQPVAVVEASPSPIIVSSRGVALTTTGESTPLPRIRLRVEPPALGSVYEDERVLGAAEFFAALDTRLRPGAVMFEVEGEMWLELAGYTIRLGRPIEMPQKAAALEALLAETLPDQAIINLIAPSRPTVRPGDEPPATTQPSSDT